MKIGIFYGSTYGNTQEAGEQLVALLGTRLGEPVQIFDMHSTNAEELATYDFVLVGCSTWNDGEIQDDWADRLDEVAELDFSGKFVALFGCGDQITYAETFADALGMIGEQLREKGARLIGKWPTEGYDFVFSRADLGDGHFIGLPLDYDNQSELTASRLSAWADQLVTEVHSVVAA